MVSTSVQQLVGKSFESSLRVTEELIEQFAGFSGDRNPIHVSDEAARNRGFDRRVAHGVIQASLLSAIVGMELPGAGSVMQQMELKWLRPCHPGDEITIRLEVIEAHESVQTVICDATVTSGQGSVISRGRVQVGIGGVSG